MVICTRCLNVGRYTTSPMWLSPQAALALSMAVEMPGQIFNIFFWSICCIHSSHSFYVSVHSSDIKICGCDHSIDNEYQSLPTFECRWGIPGIGYLQRGKNRPKLLYIKDSRHFDSIWKFTKSLVLSRLWQPVIWVIFFLWQLLICRDLLMENWFFLDAPRWTVDIEAVDGMEVSKAFQIVGQIYNLIIYTVKHSSDPILWSLCKKNWGGWPWPGRPHSIQHGWFWCFRFFPSSLNNIQLGWFWCVRFFTHWLKRHSTRSMKKYFCEW